MATDSPIVLWGAAGHARVVADIIRAQGLHELLGFIDDVNPERKGQRLGHANILGGREALWAAQKSGAKVIVAIGSCEARQKLSAVAREHGLELATVVHPSATVASDVHLGQGTVVAAGAVINTGARLGDSVIVNTSASVDHDCVIGEASHIAPGAHLAGSVLVGEQTWVGIGAVVIESRRIGSRVVLGAGSVVVSDIPDGVVAYGNPARVKRRAT